MAPQGDWSALPCQDSSKEPGCPGSFSFLASCDLARPLFIVRPHFLGSRHMAVVVQHVQILTVT
jgi:hypothetical protein